MGNIVIRSGAMADSGWICGLLAEGVRHGHFGSGLDHHGTKLIDLIVNRGGYSFPKDRDGIQYMATVTATLRVAEIGNVPASFLICIREGSEVELHLAATDSKFRRKGAFRMLVRDAINAELPYSRIYGRCSKLSTAAANCLRDMGFDVRKGPIADEYSRV